jgi:hypothetical protein
MKASKSKPTTRTTRRKAFAATPREAYLLAVRITEAGKYFSRERQLLSSPPKGPAEELARQALARLAAAKKRFETRLLTDPAGAVNELDRIRVLALDVSRHNGRHATRDAELQRAREHVAEWLAQREDPEHFAFRAFPVRTLSPISRLRSIRSEGDLVNLVESDADVQRALHPTRGEFGDRTGPLAAAEIIIEVVSGHSQSTTRRASGSVRARK